MALSTFTLLKTLTLAKLTKHFPVLPGWFAPEALEAEGELYKLLDTAADEAAELQEEISKAKAGLHLETARGEYLAKWSREADVPQLPDETEPEWAARIQREILRERVTASGIIESIEEATGLEVSLEFPWRKQFRYGERTPTNASQKDAEYGYSGSRRWTSRYYKGGVLDIVTIGWSPYTRPAAVLSVGASVAVFYTARLYVAAVPAPTLEDPKASTILFRTVYMAAPETVQRQGRVLHREVDAARHFNYLVFTAGLAESVLTVDDLAGFTWEEAIAGPISVMPKPNFWVVTDP